MLYNVIMNDELKPIPGFPDYSVTKDGRVWSRSNRWGRGQWLKPSKDRNGYSQVVLCKGDKSYSRKVHRLVLETYVGHRPVGMQCRHLNGDPADNRLENLTWGTRSENTYDSIGHGTYVDNRGEKSGNAKLTDENVLEIRRLLALGMAQRNIGRVFSVSHTTVNYINRGKTWKHI